MKRKRIKICLICIVVLSITTLIGLIITGRKTAWGPFADLYDWDGEVNKIADRYPVKEHQNGIIFYGASNFRLWAEMENDLSDYKVQNHGFGGSTDKLLKKYADILLYPYNPEIVFFQTGSNDYVSLSGTDKEKVERCMEYKEKMFADFHEILPEAKFVIMSGLLLPGRSEYTDITMQINKRLKELCDQTEWLYFVDSSQMTYDGKNYEEDLFQSDGIHLNHKGQLLWMQDYIQPIIEQLIQQYDMENLRIK